MISNSSDSRNLVKRPTISIGYGAGSKSENFFGLVSLKDNTSPPREWHWEYYRKSVRKKVIVDCPVCSEFKDEDLLKVHTVAVSSPLFKSIQKDCNEGIVIQITKWITEEINKSGS